MVAVQLAIDKHELYKVGQMCPTSLLLYRYGSRQKRHMRYDEILYYSGQFGARRVRLILITPAAMATPLNIAIFVVYVLSLN